MKKAYEIKPIGVVHGSNQGFALEIFEPYRPALEKLDQFSHALIFWWADQNDNTEARDSLTVNLPYAEGLQAGVFACRSQMRPNPVAVTTCALINVDVESGMVILPWIDAFDGTPVIDIKPFIPTSDRVRDFHVSSWMAEWPEWMEDAAEYFQSHAVDFGD